MPKRGRGGGQDSEAAQSVNVQARKERKEKLFAKVNLEKQFSIKRLKVLGAMTFERTANATDVEKYFGVIGCLEERKVKLATFFLEGNNKDSWILYTTKRVGVDFVTWEGFRRGLQEKFHPRLFVHEKRRDFLSLIQGNKVVSKYEKKFTKLAKYTSTNLGFNDTTNQNIVSLKIKKGIG
ncbi:uncharacterized protein E5676_scaffold3068G00100 [Cucumis melo var. makuwa]|uniref:Retrotransposon gag domain-containing protein n=1 Tax=Cucumis melo var. makuwa TaxID=1194695 RepID=A0A5D3CYI7_CUCMM|nr:uncharacterized protein E5676_scaffold3068G00100 [Cucumis melo var. makuwa]